MDYETVLHFWFQELTADQWWVKDGALDEVIRQRFLTLHHQAISGELAHWRTAPRGRLAEIIVLDQFSRNMFRDSDKAFASDPQALALAQEAVLLAEDEKLTAVERSFLYMPYMHSESLLVQHQAVELFKHNGIEANYQFAIRHRDIIQRFGRYPHRNAVLKRDSTEQERAFLQQPGSSF